MTTKVAPFKKLTSHIYGPYYDHEFFREKYPPPNITLEVRDLELYAGEEDVGLDDTEFIGPPPAGSLGARNAEITFFAVYELLSLDCLSEKGLEELEADVRELDGTENLNNSRSKITLRTIYGDRNSGSKLKIRLAGRKMMSAIFLSDPNDPSGFYLYSKYDGNLKRRYSIMSLHVSTMSKSRNFFDRFRMRALIEELIKTDPKKTTIQDRDISWLINRYLEEICPRSKDSSSRILFLSDDPSLENEIAGDRHLNHLPGSRIRGLFAAQAEWYLAHMLASSSQSVKHLDIKKWIRFCHRSRKDSIAAFTADRVHWGVPHGQAPPRAGEHYSLSKNLAKHGYSEEFWKRALRNATQKSTKRHELTPPLSPISKPPGDGDRGKSPVVRQFQYDSDFSEASTPGASDSDSLPIPASAIISPVFWQEPQIPNGSTKWMCPHRDCEYLIDLLDIPPESYGLLPPQIATLMQGRSWRVGDEVVKQGLCSLVSAHYQSTHLTLDLVISSQGRGHTLVRPRVTSAKMSTRAPVKLEKEDSGVSLDQLRRSARKAHPRSLTQDS